METDFDRLFRRMERAAAASDSQGPSLLRDASADCAKGLAAEIDAGHFELPLFRQEIMPDGAPPKLVPIKWQWPAQQEGPTSKAQTAETNAWACMWWCLTNSICTQYELGFDPMAMRTVSKANGIELLTSHSDDWRSRTEHFTRICDWLRRKLSEKIAAQQSTNLKDVIKPTNSDSIVTWDQIAKAAGRSPDTVREYRSRFANAIWSKKAGSKPATYLWEESRKVLCELYSDEKIPEQPPVA
jgi:hypothetical protein